MAMPHEIEKLAHSSLEDVLLKLYPATTLRWLYDVSLQALVEAHPAELPQPEPSKRSGVQSVPKKDYLMALLLVVLRKPALGRRFFESLPRTVRDLLTALTWERRVNLAALERRLGFEVATVNPDQRRVYWEPFLLRSEHGLVVIQRRREPYWSSAGEKPNKEEYGALLPDAVRNVFKAFATPPAGHALTPLETLPASGLVRYSCAQKAVSDLRLVAEYIAQGHLTLTRSERVAIASLKALHQMTGGPEFFEDSAEPDLVRLRTQLLVGGMACAGPKEREKLLERPDSAEPVRAVMERVVSNASLLHAELLGHLLLSRNRSVQYSVPSVKALASFFSKLPGGKWIAWENLRSYHALREELPTLFGPHTMWLDANVESDKDRWTSTLRVDEDNVFDLVSEPLLKGYAFLLAAFGLTEIAYTLPSRDTYRRQRLAYLSPYGGLRFVRLTPLGEFVFRQRDTYESPAAPALKSYIRLDEARLLAICRNTDQLTELALDQFFEKLAPGRYRMTPKSLLGGCASRQDIEERIRLFRRVVSAHPPAIWEQFFQQTLARIAPLSFEPEYVVLKVSADDEIRRHLASDPALREVVLKVEGLRIAVRQSDLKKLAKRLEQFGYLSPLPRH